MSTTIPCARCGALCPADARFCIECGQSVVVAVTDATTRLPKLSCPVCQVTNEPGGRFCAHCGADLFAPRVPTQPMPRPARRSYPRVNTLPPTLHAPVPHSAFSPHSGLQPGTLVILAGIVLLLITRSIWPGILLVVGVGQFLNNSQAGRGQAGFRQLLWLGGLALLFATGTFWPGIILLFVIHKVLD